MHKQLARRPMRPGARRRTPRLHTKSKHERTRMRCLSDDRTRTLGAADYVEATRGRKPASMMTACCSEGGTEGIRIRFGKFGPRNTIMHATKIPMYMFPMTKADLSEQRCVSGKTSAFAPPSTEPTIINPPFPKDAGAIAHDPFPRSEPPHPARVRVLYPHC